MIIENRKEMASIYDKLGIERIFIDLEILKKNERQGYLDTVISDHKVEDINKVREGLKNAKLLVRVNPLNPGSSAEIDDVISRGADIIMLPMFKTVDEVRSFVDFVSGRVTTNLLLETSQAFCRIEDILEVEGINEIHIGLNDLYLSLGLDFIFEPLKAGIIDFMVEKIKTRRIKYGFGGVARIGEGILPAEMILREHARLGSSMVILSRTFTRGIEGDAKKLSEEINKIRAEVSHSESMSPEELIRNSRLVKEIIKKHIHSVSI